MPPDISQWQTISSKESGYYQGFDRKQGLRLAEKEDVAVAFLHPIGSYVLKGTPLLKIKGHIKEKQLGILLLDVDFYYGHEIDKNLYYGFFHLMEIGVKALSPGINDPGTAVLSLNAMTDLLPSC